MIAEKCQLFVFLSLPGMKSAQACKHSRVLRHSHVQTLKPLQCTMRVPHQIIHCCDLHHQSFHLRPYSLGVEPTVTHQTPWLETIGAPSVNSCSLVT